MGAFGHLVLGLLLMLNIGEATRQQQGKVRMCYFSNQAQDRPGRGRFVPGNIDDSLCTHIIYAYAHITANGTSVETTHSNDYDLFKEVIDMKRWKPSLKVLLSVGGPGDIKLQNDAFAMMVSRQTEKTAFITNIIAFLRQYGFDGLDMNWRYPAPTYRVQFENFIKKLREVIIQEALTSRQEMLMITVAAWGRHDKMLYSYDPSRLAQYVDYFLLNTYDLWDTRMPRLGHHTALSSGVGVASVNKTVTSWLSVVTSRKIVLGLATFGKTARLIDPLHHSLGDNFTLSPATPGFYTRDRRSLAYYEVCERLNTKGLAWTSEYVAGTEGVLAYSTQPTYDWVCYDDRTSFRVKATYALQHNLAGVFFSSMDLDDFSGEFCLQDRYPLLREVQEVFDKFVPPTTSTSEATTTTTTQPTTFTSTTTPPTTTTITTTQSTTATTSLPPTTTITTTTQPTTANPAPPTTSPGDCKPFKCPDAPSSGNPDFLYPDPFDCHKYYQCVMPGIMSMYYSMDCPAGLVFDRSSLRCEYPWDSPCEPCPEEAMGELEGNVWGRRFV